MLPGFQPSLEPADWIESDNALLVNRLTMDSQGHQIFVGSDTVFQAGDIITSDGQSLTTAVGLITTFHDLGDRFNVVAELGSTWVLLLLGLALLLGPHRLNRGVRDDASHCYLGR